VPKALIITRRYPTVDGSLIRSTTVVSADSPEYPALLKAAYQRQAVFGEPVPFLDEEPDLAKIASRPIGLFGNLAHMQARHTEQESAYDAKHTAASSSTPPGMQWITIHPNNAGEGEGRHVLIDENTKKIEAGLPQPVMDKLNNEHQAAPEPAGASPEPAPPMPQTTGQTPATPAPPPEPAVSPSPQPEPADTGAPPATGITPPTAPEPAAQPAPAQEPPPSAAPENPDALDSGASAPAEGPAGAAPETPPSAAPGGGSPPENPPIDNSEGSADSRLPNTAGPADDMAPDSTEESPETPAPETEEPQSILTPPAPPLEPAHEGHLQHANVLRERARMASSPEEADAFNRHADTLEDIARHPENLDQHILAHREQTGDRLYPVGDPGMFGAAWKRPYGDPEFNSIKDAVKELPGNKFNGKKYNPNGDDTWRLPMTQLHNAIGKLPGFSVNPRTLMDGSEIVGDERMAGSGDNYGDAEAPEQPQGAGHPGEMPPDGTSPQDAMAATNVMPPDAELPPEACTPIDTPAGALFNKAQELDGQEDLAIPWSEAAVAAMRPAGESHISDQSALTQYSEELGKRAARQRKIATDINDIARNLSNYDEQKKLRKQAQGHNDSATKLERLADRAERYAHSPHSMEYDANRFEMRKPYDRIDHQDGKATFHQYGGVERDDKYNDQGKKTGNPTLDKLKTLPGYKKQGGTISFNPGQLSTAMEHFPKHNIHPHVIRAAAHEFARNNAPPPAWEHPPDFKTVAEGGRELFAFQKYGASLSAARDRNMLALDMGLGKTATSLASFCRRRQMGTAKKAMAIVPSATIFNWKGEVEKYTHLKVAVCLPKSALTADGRQKPEDTETQEEKMRAADIVIAGYGDMNATTSRDRLNKEIQALRTEREMHQASVAGFEDDLRHSLQGNQAQRDFHNKAVARIAAIDQEIASKGDPEDTADDDSKLDALMSLGADHLIIDEAHNLKNPTSQRSKAFREHLMGMSSMQLLTGTPMHNKPQDVHQMTEMVSPGLLGTRAQFISRYVDQRAGADGNSVDAAYKNLDELCDRAKPAMFYLSADDPHAKKQLAGAGLTIPPRIEEARNITMSPAQSKLYTMFKKAGTAILSSMRDYQDGGDDEGGGGSNKEKKEMLVTLGLRMQQIAVDPRLLDLSKVPNSEEMTVLGGGHEIRRLVNEYARETDGVSTKVQEASNIIQQHFTNGGKGAVIYTGHNNGPEKLDPKSGKMRKQEGMHLKLIRDGVMKRNGLRSDQVAILETGNNTARQELINRYNNPRDPLRVLIITKAASEGVNLQGHHDDPGGGGDLMIHLNREWLYGQQDQTDRRISRLGQDRTTRHVLLHAVTTEGKNTNDHKMAARLDQKRSVGGRILEGKPGENRVEISTGFDVESKKRPGHDDGEDFTEFGDE